MRTAAPASRGRAVGPEPRTEAAPDRRETWFKVGILFCAALLAGVVAAAVAASDEAPPPPRVEVAPSSDDVLYEDQYVRVWADPPKARVDQTTETQP